MGISVTHPCIDVAGLRFSTIASYIYRMNNLTRRLFLHSLVGFATAVPLAAQESAQPAAQNVEVPVVTDPVDAWREDPKVRFTSRDVSLSDFKWIARPLVVFAESEFDPAFQRQIDLLTGRADDLAQRDVVVITDTEPSELSELRRKLRPRGFMLALIGKDGGVKLRKPFPWDVREISRSIDKMPMRRQEIPRTLEREPIGLGVHCIVGHKLLCTNWRSGDMNMGDKTQVPRIPLTGRNGPRPGY